MQATELFETLESLKPYVGEVWEADSGLTFTLLAVGDVAVFFRGPLGREDHCGLSIWLDQNNLPQSIRNAPKPEMVTKEKAKPEKQLHILEVAASLNEEGYQRLKQQVAELFGEGNFLLLEGGVKYAGVTEIRKLPPAEYEVIKGGV